VSEREKSGNDPEERLVLDLLDAQTGHRILSQESESVLRRQYLEVLGLLPQALAEVPPRTEVKARILDAVRVGEIEARQVESEQVMDGPRPLVPQVARSTTGWPTWTLPLAASIALAMMAVTGWLVIQVQSQRIQIAALSSDLEAARSVVGGMATSQGMLAEVRSRLALVTAPGAEFCTLSPPPGSSAKGARGVVVMNPVQDEWFLRIEGLGRCPQGRKYTVWFATEGGDVPGPIFAVESDEPVELTVSGRPEKIKAIMITLESEPVPQAPSTAPLLFGDQRMQLL
jgi:hypothetical protein